MSEKTKQNQQKSSTREDLTLITAESKAKKKSLFWVIMSALFKGIVVSLSAVVVGVSLGSAFLANNKFWGAWLGIFVFGSV